MDTLERIRAKIAEVEAKLTDLRIAERELAALGPAPAKAAPTKVAAPPREIKARPGRKPKAVAGPRQTIGAAIAEALGDQGAFSVAEIAAKIAATGRTIDKRSISYSLQAMKKQGRVKATDGNWMLAKPRG